MPKGNYLVLKVTWTFNIYNGSFYDLRKLTISSQEQVGIDAYKNE